MKNKIPDWFVEGAKVKIIGNHSNHSFEEGEITVLGKCYSTREGTVWEWLRAGKPQLAPYWVSYQDCSPVLDKKSVKDLLGVEL
jgi:hypothetical protein